MSENFPHTIVTKMFYRGRSVVMAQSTAGGKGEADKLAALAVGIELACQAFAPNGGCVWVGDDQAAIVRHHLHRKACRDGKIKTLRECQIFLPFAVTAIIGDRAFDLDDYKLPIAVDRHYIDTPAICQFELGQSAESQVLKQFAHAAGQHAGGFGDVV